MIVEYRVLVDVPDTDEQTAKERASRVMAERLGNDDWYGFDYWLDWRRVDVSEGNAS